MDFNWRLPINVVLEMVKSRYILLYCMNIFYFITCVNTLYIAYDSLNHNSSKYLEKWCLSYCLLAILLFGPQEINKKVMKGQQFKASVVVLNKIRALCIGLSFTLSNKIRDECSSIWKLCSNSAQDTLVLTSKWNWV